MMFDPSGMYPDLYHPVRPEKRRDFNGKATHYSRTQRPPKYYLIDFGLSRRYEDDISTVVEPVIVGGDRTAPEHAEDRGATPCNPFQTDVYYIGNMVREEFIRVRPPSLCTLSPLLNPARRKLTISSSWHHSLAVDPCFARERVWDDLPTFTCPKSLFLARHNAYLYFSEYV
jgi:hypothetical protein